MRRFAPKITIDALAVGREGRMFFAGTHAQGFGPGDGHHGPGLYVAMMEGGKLTVTFGGGHSYLERRQRDDSGNPTRVGDGVFEMGVDRSSNVFAVGAFVGTGRFGGLVATSPGKQDMFLWKFSVAQARRWRPVP